MKYVVVVRPSTAGGGFIVEVNGHSKGYYLTRWGAEVEGAAHRPHVAPTHAEA